MVRRPPASAALLVTLGMAALAVGCCPRQARPEAATDTAAEYVVVNWLATDRFYIGQVTERREGLVGVRYPDGSREWAEPERVTPLRLAAGQRVHVRWGTPSAPEYVGEVLDVRGDLVQLRFEEGRGQTWVSLAMVSRLAEAATAATAQPAAGEAAAAEATTLPVLPPVAASSITVGATVVVLYRGQTRYGAEVLELAGERVRVAYFFDSTEAWVPTAHVVRVFDQQPGQLSPGLRVRYVSERGMLVGTIMEQRDDLVRIALNEQSRGAWIEAASVVEAVSLIDPVRLTAGAQVGALHHGRIWGAAVVEARDQTVRIRWNREGREAEVALADIVEVF